MILHMMVKKLWEKALNNEYNVILLDVMLPKLDGIEVCKKIREVSDVPIIMLQLRLMMRM